MRARDELRRSHPLSALELSLLERMLPVGHPDREPLLAQAQRATATWLDSHGQPAILFQVPDGTRLCAQDGVVTEADALDLDRGAIHLLLHVKHGKLAEVELYREDGRAIIEFPDIAKLRPY